MVSWGLLFDPHPSLGSMYVYNLNNSASESSRNSVLRSALRPSRPPREGRGVRVGRGTAYVCSAAVTAVSQVR